MLFYKYINKERSKLLKSETNTLTINKLGTPDIGHSFKNLFKPFKK